MPELLEPSSRIVVGVDGSERSLGALRWAVAQARCMGSELHVITAWFYPEFPTPFGIVPELPLPAEPMAEARRRLNEAVESVLGTEPNLELRVEVVRGNPTTVLLDAAKGADLLVVGAQGMGRLEALFLGSVCERCVRQATCPVVVIHGHVSASDRP